MKTLYVTKHGLDFELTKMDDAMSNDEHRENAEAFAALLLSGTHWKTARYLFQMLQQYNADNEGQLDQLP